MSDTTTPPVTAASATPTAPAKPKLRKKLKKSGRGRGREAPDEAMWIELQNKYESGEYSQRDLSKYASAKGFTVSQSRIAEMAVQGNWVKGSVRADIREKVMDELKEGMVKEIRSMLERHSQSAGALQSEAIRHLTDAAEQRKVNPHFKIAPAPLATITTILRDAQLMEARAKGWNYKEGKPFEVDKEPGKEDLPKLTVTVMSEEEEKLLREGGLNLGPDGGEA